MEFRAGKRSDMALVGACLEAEQYAHIRALFKTFCG